MSTHVDLLADSFFVQKDMSQPPDEIPHKVTPATSMETRDDRSIPSLLDEDLVVALPFTNSVEDIRDPTPEAIEIINISFLHE